MVLDLFYTDHRRGLPEDGVDGLLAELADAWYRESSVDSMVHADARDWYEHPAVGLDIAVAYDDTYLDAARVPPRLTANTATVTVTGNRITATYDCSAPQNEVVAYAVPTARDGTIIPDPADYSTGDHAIVAHLADAFDGIGIDLAREH